ncbi:MAG TPA: PHP domain-containing protein [Pseudonocardiaceae bacterium]
MRIDLHTHSTASDGTDTPAQLVTAAAAAGLDVVALTDHDTTAGWAEAAAALPPGMRLVPGAELSCSCPDGRGGEITVHLLAYLFDPGAPDVVAEQDRLREERRSRLRRMAERMAADGFAVDPDELLASVPEGSSAGRPHLARALVRLGVVSTVGEAFDRFLHNGSPYYLPRRDTPVQRAVEMISRAGGVTVLAHAFAHRRGPVVTPGVIADLATHGLTGLEVDHPEHDAEAREQLRALADELSLVPTGSSDYHGSNKTVRLGQETTSPEALEELVGRAVGEPISA